MLISKIGLAVGNRTVTHSIKRSVVLIVEDEFLIRMDAVDMIRAVGFDVVDAANAYEAILSSKITKQALTD